MDALTLPKPSARDVLLLRTVCANLSQREFARVLGFTENAVQKWEAGERSMKALDFHAARLLFDDQYAAKWIFTQMGKRERLWPLLLHLLGRKA